MKQEIIDVFEVDGEFARDTLFPILEKEQVKFSTSVGQRYYWIEGVKDSHRLRIELPNDVEIGTILILDSTRQQWKVVSKDRI